ncbi:MAG: AGE family epimerase/isomerase [Candidatus Limiplasma sp.]|nr:AGE family epimerase/isomerase [Candidatus Limiplasma sp.]
MEKLVEQVKAELTGHILPFWKGLLDAEYGGYYGEMGTDLQVRKHANKGTILNSRILWFFSKAAAALQDASLTAYADHAYRFLTDVCMDSTHGGVVWEVSYDGRVMDGTKHTYNQAFAIYALCAYYELTHRKEALEQALELMRLIECRCRDEKGYLEAFTQDFQPTSNEKLSENGVMAYRTMNTLLHVFEAYSGLYAVTHDELVADKLRGMIHLYLEKIYNPSRKRQEVFFDEAYRSLIDLHSYGHDIESAWLLDWGCSLLEDDALLERLRASLQEMTRQVYREAFVQGSLLNECDRGEVNATRVWWVQAEAMVGFLHAWQLKPEETEFRDAVIAIWQYIQQHIIDQRPGSEWFWEADANGNPNMAKDIVEPWKCPYHNGRMCMEIIRRLS